MTAVGSDTVSSWAERVLLGTSLEDKLAPPPRRDAPGPAWASAPETPGRPEGLGFTGERGFLPRPSGRLSGEEERASALHAFANHELLALEVLALALLRFPDAEPAFRAELVATARDEQLHLRLYLQRLGALGVPFGSHPVHGRFWRLLADMERPHDLVVRLSLTLEQANLDFASYYQARFAEAGDAETAGVLERVLRDEVAHVRRGARWHEAWKDPAQTSFDAWVAALPSDLSPTRARGRGFQAGLRTRAGLDEDFVRRLQAWGWSHGRPARRWRANLDAELTLAGGGGGASAREVAADLAPLVAWLAASGDTVEVHRPPSTAWWADQVAHGAPRAHLVGPGVPSPEPTPARAAWARVASEVDEHPTPTRWLAKPAVLPLRAALRATDPRLEEILGPPILDGRCVHTLAELEACRAEMAAAGDWPLVAKQAFGASGRGARRLPSRGPLDAPTLGWLERALGQEPGLVVEPWLTRVADLSVLADLDAEGAPWIRRALVGAAGRYEGHVLGDPWSGLPEDLRRWAHTPGSVGLSPRALLERAGGMVVDALRDAGVRGRVGVDALVARTADGWWLRPQVEVNARATMGHVATAVEARVARGSHAVWRLHAGPALDDLRKAALPAPRRDDVGQVVEGVWWLTPLQDARRVAAALWVAPTAGGLAELEGRPRTQPAPAS